MPLNRILRAGMALWSRFGGEKATVYPANIISTSRTNADVTPLFSLALV